MNLIVGPQVPSHLTDRERGARAPGSPAPTPSPLLFRGVAFAFFLEVVIGVAATVVL